MVKTNPSHLKEKYKLLSEKLDRELLKISFKENKENIVYLPDLIKKQRTILSLKQINLISNFLKEYKNENPKIKEKI